MRLTLLISLICLLVGLAQAQPVQSPANDSIQRQINVLRSDANRLIKLSTENAYAEARTLLDSSLTLAISVHGTQDTVVAAIYRKLAIATYWHNQYDQADSLLQLARGIWSRTPGDNRKHLADIDRVRSDCHWITGKYTEALMIIQHAHELISSLSDTSHHYCRVRSLVANSYALTLDNLARQDEAIDFYREALEFSIRGDAGDFAMPGIIRLHLSSYAMTTGDYDSARTYVDQATEHIHRVLGPDHFYAGTCAFYSGELYRLQGRLSDARTYYEQAIKIREKAFGSQTKYICGMLAKLAGVEGKLGNPDSAVVLAERGLEIGLANYSPGHPSLDYLQRHLAFFYAVAEQPEKALPLWVANLEERREFVSGVFSYASEQQKLKYLRSRPLLLSTVLTVAAKNSLSLATEEAFVMVASGKAFLVDALAEERRVAACAEDSRAFVLLDSLSSVCNRIASLTLSGSKGGSQDHISAQLAIQYELKETLEQQLSLLCAEFGAGARLPSVDVGSLAKALEERTVLWDIVRYYPYRFENYGTDSLTSPARYVAFCLDAGANLAITDLGSASSVDSMVTRFLDVMDTSPSLIYSGQDLVALRQLEEVSSQLYGTICAPLLAKSGDVERIIICPDGLLNLLPFEILSSGSGRFMVEQFQVSYLSASRDLLKNDHQTLPVSGAPVVVSAVDYDNCSQVSSTVLADIATEAELPLSRTLRSAAHCLSEPFRNLPGTVAEGNAVVSHLQQPAGVPVVHLSGDQASEANLKSLAIQPDVLHIATHGFICPESRFTDRPIEDNPLLYSGVALSGANNRLDQSEFDSEENGDDGILTSLEASALNLQATRLIVLSACNSGQAQIRSGEGIYGLRRAFQLAGARSIIMSLFSVPDEATTDLMKSFYQNWLAGQSKGVSLREAQLQIIRDRRSNNQSTHPLFWGGFILVGDPD